MKSKGLVVFLLLLSTSVLGGSDTFHFSFIYSDAYRKEKFHGFYDEVLRFVPADQMDDLIHQEVMRDPGANDQKIYSAIRKIMPEINPGSIESMSKVIEALNHQRQVLGEQSKALVLDKYEIDGYLEIGTDGTYINSLQERFAGGFKGITYILNDKEPGWFDSVSYLKRNTFFQNYQFVPSRNFSPIAEADIPTESLDMVTMYVGLHHTVAEKLDDFLESLNRILREGGVFILRDHDLNEMNESYVHLAHMTFNLATDVTMEDEVNEYRDFHPMQYWVDIVERHGFSVQSERLQQEGDPSDNTLIRFTKVVSTDFVKSQQHLRENTSYLRPEDQSILTTPEWWIVWNSQDYVRFVQENPSHQFPYFESIGSYWWVYLNSLMNTKETNPGYNFMNIFLGAVQGTEYALKGIFNKIMPRKDYTNPEIAKIQNEYGNFLNHSPFYDFPYEQKYKEFKSNNQELDWESALFISEYRLKSGLSPLLSSGSKSTYGEAVESISMIVYDPSGELTDIDERIEVVFSSGEYHAVKVPRYQPFTEIILKIGQSSVRVEEVAGNQWITMAIEARGGESDSVCHLRTGCEALFSVNSVVDKSIKRSMIKVDLRKINDVLIEINELPNSFVKHIFDY